MQSKYMTVPEVSEYLRTPIATIRLYIREGRLHAVKIGRKYLLEKENVDKDIQGFNK